MKAERKLSENGIREFCIYLSYTFGNAFSNEIGL